MEYEVVVPATADGALMVTIVSWLKAPGDAVVKDEDLAEAATEKITLYITAPDNGTLKSILIKEGEQAGVGDVIGVVEAGGDE